MIIQKQIRCFSNGVQSCTPFFVGYTLGRKNLAAEHFLKIVILRMGPTGLK